VEPGRGVYRAWLPGTEGLGMTDVLFVIYDFTALPSLPNACRRSHQ